MKNTQQIYIKKNILFVLQRTGSICPVSRFVRHIGGSGYLNTNIVLSLVGTSCTTLLYDTNLTVDCNNWKTIKWGMFIT